MDNKLPFNPLKFLWTTLGNIGGILALSSLVETWLSDIFKWKGFLANVLEAHRNLTQPVFNLLFGWFPFAVPLWVNDYIIFGSMLFIVIRLHSASPPPGQRLIMGMLLIPFWLYVVFLWPVLLVLFAILAIGKDTRGLGQHLLYRSIFAWYGAMFLLLAILLAVNTQLNMSGNV